MSGLTRRALLARGAAAGAGLVAVGCGGLGAARPAATAAPPPDFALLADPIAAALSAEGQLRGRSRDERGNARRRLARLADAKGRHAGALQSALRELDEPVPDGRGLVFALAPGPGLEAALRLGDALAGGYSRVLPRLRTPELRTTVAFVLAEEVASGAALRAALGREPVTGAFA